MPPRGCRRLREDLIEISLSYPEAWADHPWGETVAKVRKKVFVFFGMADSPDCVAMTVKLPESAEAILNEEWAEPAGYGLGRSGWIWMRLPGPVSSVPRDLLEDLIDESYRAVAPKTLVRQLDEERSPTEA